MSIQEECVISNTNFIKDGPLSYLCHSHSFFCLLLYKILGCKIPLKWWLDNQEFYYNTIQMNQNSG